jgi:pyridoxine 4-dehydrogenase
MTSTTDPVAASGTITLGGDLTVHRLGYGAMRITGPGIWGPPADLEVARQVLRRAVELGVDFIDTADSYGPFWSEDLIREALHPYDGVTIATKGGLTRNGPNAWEQLARPEYLRQCVEMSLRRLDVERIDLWQLHRIDKLVALEDSLGAIRDFQAAGKIRHVGLSEVGVAEIKQAQAIVPIVSVQNMYNVGHRAYEDVLDYCEQEGIAFIPWAPVASGKLANKGSLLEQIAASHGATTGQLALAWLLKRSPVMLPIPGTGSVAHLEENLAAAEIVLTDEEFEALAEAGGAS